MAEDNAMAVYAIQLENALLIISEAFQEGDSGYAERVACMMAARISAERKAAGSPAERETVH